MRRRPRNRQPRLDALAARVEHAAEEINPFLVVIAVGLVVLNLIALALLAPRLSVTRLGVSRAAATGAPPPRLGGLQ
jgi:hypothetical protein